MAWWNINKKGEAELDPEVFEPDTVTVTGTYGGRPVKAVCKITTPLRMKPGDRISLTWQLDEDGSLTTSGRFQ